MIFVLGFRNVNKPWLPFFGKKSLQGSNDGCATTELFPAWIWIGKLDLPLQAPEGYCNSHAEFKPRMRCVNMGKCGEMRHHNITNIFCTTVGTNRDIAVTFAVPMEQLNFIRVKPISRDENHCFCWWSVLPPQRWAWDTIPGLRVGWLTRSMFVIVAVPFRFGFESCSSKLLLVLDLIWLFFSSIIPIINKHIR